jgi:phosphate-selective porin
MRKLSIVAGLLLLSPAISQAKTLDDLLVEKGVITKAEAMSASGAAASKTWWSQGTRWDFPSEGFTAQLNTTIQPRYTFTDNDEEASAKNNSSFDMHLVALAVSGSAMHEEFTYRVDAAFDMSDGSTGASAGTKLRDAWLQWNACDWASIRMGQFKTQLDRQFNTNDHTQQFADNSLASNTFNLGRQNGLAAWGNFADGQFQLSAGIYNGLSDGEGQNRGGVDTKHTGIVSARWNAMGKMDVSEEGDIGWTDNAAVSIGAAYAFSDGTRAALGGDFDQDNISVDANFKWKGWSVHGEYYLQSTDADMAGSDSVDPMGFYAQVGYFLDPKKVEVAARYSLVDCDDGAFSGGMCAGNDKVNEVSVGLNYYWWKHNLKGQLNFVHDNQRVLGDGDDINTNKWMFQLSSYF